MEKTTKVKTKCDNCFHQYTTYIDSIEKSMCGMAPPEYISDKQWDKWREEYVIKWDGGNCEDSISREVMNEIFDDIRREEEMERALDTKREWQQSTY